MARTSKTNQLVNMGSDEFNRMSTAELKKAVATLAREGNKRITEFKREGESSPAYRYIEKSGGKFTSSGKSLNQLRAEFIRASDFIKASTGSVQGWRKVKTETMDALSGANIEVDEEHFDEFWKAYEKLKETHPKVATAELKYKVLAEIGDLVTDRRRNADSIARKLSDELTEIYEKEEALKNDVGGVSGFIKTEKDI